MLHFVRTFISYNIIGAIDSSWSQFTSEMEKVKEPQCLELTCQCDSIDSFISFHNNFLDTCLTRSLLSSPDLISVRIDVEVGN